MAKIELGRVVATARVWELIDSNERFNRFVSGCITRFVMSDWGDLTQDDWDLNEESVRLNDGRILASYQLPDFVEVEFEDKLWIILEIGESDADNVTTILFPGDY